MKKPYETPVVFEIGSVRELTLENETQDKCGGSADAAYPETLRPLFQGDCPAAPG